MEKTDQTQCISSDMMLFTLNLSVHIAIRIKSQENPKGPPRQAQYPLRYTPKIRNLEI